MFITCSVHQYTLMSKYTWCLFGLLYPITLPNTIISSSSFSVDSVRFSRSIIMSSGKQDRLIHSFQLECPSFQDYINLTGNWRGGNVLQLILWSQDYQNSKTRQRHYKKNLQTNIPQEHRWKMLNKTLVNQIQQYINNTPWLNRVFLGMQG